MKKSSESEKPRITLHEFLKWCYDKKYHSLVAGMTQKDYKDGFFIKPVYESVFPALEKAKDNKGEFLFNIDDIAGFLSQKETQEVIEKKPEIIIAILENKEEIDEICEYKDRGYGLFRAADEPSSSVIKRAKAIKEKNELAVELSAIGMFSKNPLEKKRKTINLKLGKKLKETKQGSLKAGVIEVMMKLIPEKLGKRTAKAEQKIADVIYRKKQKGD